MPLLSKILHNNLLHYFLIVSVFFIACIIIFCQTLISPTEGVAICEFYVPATFRLWYVMFYFMLGGWLSYMPKLKVSIAYLVFIIIVALFHKEYLDDCINSEYASLFYSSPIVMLLCLTIFTFIINLKIVNNTFLIEVSRLFLPVYTIHMFVIGVVGRFIPDTITPSLGAFIMWSLVSLISISLSFFIMKIPFANKIFKI